jgi:uncharacterized glyoxalase superfamily protein PhnB
MSSTEATAPPTTLGVTPYLNVADGQAAIDWYTAALGARLQGEPIVMDDGRVGHAELVVNGGMLYLAAPFPEMGLAAPEAGGTTSVTLHLTVDDVDAMLQRAIEAGATVERPAADHPHGRGASFIDPFHHRWLLHADPPGTSPRAEIAPGTATGPQRAAEVSYLTARMPDIDRARAFYSAVLGWTFTPGRVENGWEVDDAQPMFGMWGGTATDPSDGPELVPMYRVADIEAAVRRVREAGGTATDVEPQSYGLMADCTDDQGAHFYLGQHD